MELGALSFAFAKAGALGFIVAAPVGPVGAMCISRTLGSGAIVGLATGLGAATVHAVWTMVIILGAATMADPGDIDTLSRWASVAGAILLSYGGSLAWGRPTALVPSTVPIPTTIVCLSAFFSGVALTGANPTTPLLFLTTIPSVLPGPSPSSLSWIFIVVGTFAGSCCWWLILSITVAHLRHRVTPSMLAYTNKATGITLIGLAALLLLRAF